MAADRRAGRSAELDKVKADLKDELDKVNADAEKLRALNVSHP